MKKGILTTGFNMDRKQIAIQLNNVTKRYLIHHEKPTLMEKIIGGKNEEFSSLQRINLKIKNGEKIGLIGANGSGKTTLLKIIAGITSPTDGRVTVSGRIVSLIDLEAGFHPDLTGIQNIYLNGMLLGMSKKEINSKLDDIISFADIGKFIDAQLFTYSSGMKLRLGFSIAIHSNPDILLLDENISVGDQDFAKISFERIQLYLKHNKTLVIASHNMLIIKTFCKRVIWVNSGKIKADLPTLKTLKLYEDSLSQKNEK